MFMLRSKSVGAASNVPRRFTHSGLLAVCLICALAVAAFAQEEPQAWLIRLKGVINSAHAEAVKRKVEQARQEGAQLIILELDTPGGTVDASIELGDFIFKQEDVRVVAYINTNAYSGGTMVALACDEIYIDAALGMMGDVAPITPTGQEVGEKFQSPIRKVMENYAERRGYPIALVQAMVTKEIEVYRIEMEDDPAPRYITRAEFDIMPETQRQKIIPDSKKLVNPADQLLTLSAKDAVEFGFARKAVGSREALYDELAGEGAKLTVRRMYLTPAERLLAFVDTFSPLLIAVGLLLLWNEITHPGFGLPGILGIICLVTFFMVKYSLHYAHMLEILLFVAGLVLLLVEVFFIPGFGVVGGGGILLLFVSMVLMFQQFNLPKTPSEFTAFQFNILKVIGSFMTTFVGMVLIVRYLEAIPVLSRLIRRDTLAGASVEVGLNSGEPALKELVGQVGLALTPLRPTGRAEFGERLLDVVTEGDFVEKGSPVEAIAVHGRHVVVKARREV